MAWNWMTTHPSGKAHTHGADDGQTGWRLHLVGEAQQYEGQKLEHQPAICGTKPGTGWGLDLFISEPCRRCLKQIEKRNITAPQIP